MRRKVSRRVVLALVFVMLLSVPCLAADGIFSGLKGIADFIGRLIIPEQSYFHNQLASLSANFNSRFGGVSYLFQMIHSFLQSLGDVKSMEFTFTMPNDVLYPGYKGFSADVFTFIGPYVEMLRSVLTSGLCIITAISCYHKVRTFFSE